MFPQNGSIQLRPDILGHVLAESPKGSPRDKEGAEGNWAVASHDDSPFLNVGVHVVELVLGGLHDEEHVGPADAEGGEDGAGDHGKDYGDPHD